MRNETEFRPVENGRGEFAASPEQRYGELYEEVFEAGETRVSLLRPADPAALLSEEDFAANEFLPYWAEIWPAGLRLAESLPGDLRGQRVLELGCGLAIPSLVAASRGAEVLATDWSTDAIRLLHENAIRNNIAIRTAVVDWATPETLLVEAPFDIVLAADVLYESRNVEWLLPLLPALSARILLADPGREQARRFFAELPQTLHVEHLGAGVHAITAER